MILSTYTLITPNYTQIMNRRYLHSDPVRVPMSRIYGFREVAIMYYPTVSPTHASRRLRRLINGDPYLRLDLEARGFRPGARRLLPCQLACLLFHLGAPDEFVP